MTWSEFGTTAFNLIWAPVLVWTIIALVLLVAMRVLPSRFPQLRLDLSLGLVLALPLALIVSWVMPDQMAILSAEPLLSEPAAAPMAVEVTPQVATATPTESLPWRDWIGWMTAGLGIVSILSVMRFAWSWIGLRAIISRAKPVKSRHRGYPVLLSNDTRVPFSAGLTRPVIVMPADMPRANWSTIMDHEACHHERGDVWRTMLATLMQAVFVFHPLVHVMRRDITLHAEICCDHEVMQSTQVDRRSYAHLLLESVPKRRVTLPALPLSDSQSQLKHRIQAMKNPTSLPFSATQLLSLTLTVALSTALLVGCTDMEVAPTEAHVTDDAYDLVMELPAAKNFPGENQVFSVVEQSPVMIGGHEELASRVKYPELAKKAGIAGRVFIELVVDENGSVSHAQIVRGIGGGADEEALRAVQSMKFIPGVQRGQRVKVKMHLPVTFRLEEYDVSIPPPPPPVSSETEIELSQLARTVYEAQAQYLEEELPVDASADLSLELREIPVREYIERIDSVRAARDF